MNKTSAICFFVAGNPAGQPRVKAANRGGFTSVYTPKTVKTKLGRKPHPAVVWKNQVAEAWSKSKPHNHEKIQRPVKLTLSFFIPRPKSHFTSKGLLKPTAPNFCPKKPDFDNLEKAVSDQLTTCGVWEDDDQVCISVTVKRFADSNEAQGCEVQIEVLPE